LFSGGRRGAERRKADHQYVRASQGLRLLGQVVALEVQQAFLEHRETTERLILAAKAIQDAKATIRSYDDQYKAGLIAPKDMPNYFKNLVTARLLYSTVQADYYQLLHAYNVTVAKVRLATGSDELPPFPEAVQPAAGLDTPGWDGRGAGQGQEKAAAQGP